MAPGSSPYPHNPVKNKDGAQPGRFYQEVVASGKESSLANIDANCVVHVTTGHQQWPTLNKTILPPPKKRHHSTNPNPPQPSRVIHYECKENKGEQGGNMTSRIALLSPGSKRKLLGYSADGSIPPLPPRQKRLKRVAKQRNRDSKQCNKFTRMVEPSELLGDLKPGIMRQQTRTRQHIHALLGAVVGDLLRKDYHPPSEPVVLSSGFAYHENLEKSAEPSLQDLEDRGTFEVQEVLSCATTQCGSMQITGQSEQIGVLKEPCKRGAIAFTDESNAHAKNSVSMRIQQEVQSKQRVRRIRDAYSCEGNNFDIRSRENYPFVEWKQQPEPISSSLLKTCAGELDEIKQEQQGCDCPLGSPSLCGDARPCFNREEAESLQPEDSKMWVSVAAANVAKRWLELLSLDVKGRLSALKRSKRRVGSAIVSGELDLDAPLLPCTSAGAPSTGCWASDGHRENGSRHEPQVDSWRNVFESMDRALTLEGTKLESWLQQIHVMQAECRRDMSMPFSVGPSSCSEPISGGVEDTDQAFAASAASILSTANFATQLGDFLKISR